MSMIAVELTLEVRVLEGIRCLHLLRPLNLLTHLPQDVDWFQPGYGELGDFWPHGYGHPFQLVY